MKDLLNDELFVGDYVFVVRKNYRNMVLARIIRFTTNKIRVVFPSLTSSTLLTPEEFLTDQVVKVSPEKINQMTSYKKTKLDEVFKPYLVAIEKESLRKRVSKL